MEIHVASTVNPGTMPTYRRHKRRGSQRRHDKGEAAIHNDDAVAQRIYAIHTDEGQRAHQHPGHSHSEEKARQRRQRSDNIAGLQEQEDGAACEEGYFAYIDGWKPEIREGLPNERIPHQQAGEQHEVIVAQATRV